MLSKIVFGRVGPGLEGTGCRVAHTARPAYQAGSGAGLLTMPSPAVLRDRYGRRGSEVAARELRSGTRGLIRRANAGERIVITVNGRPAAELVPPRSQEQRHWSPGADIARLLRTSSADPGLRDDLRRLADGTTDELDGP